MSKNPQDANINVVIRSVWRRFKKDLKEAIIRDLEPRKDIKGGSGIKGQSKSATGGSDTPRGR